MASSSSSSSKIHAGHGSSSSSSGSSNRKSGIAGVETRSDSKSVAETQRVLRYDDHYQCVRKQEWRSTSQVLGVLNQLQENYGFYGDAPEWGRVDVRRALWKRDTDKALLQEAIEHFRRGESGRECKDRVFVAAQPFRDAPANDTDGYCFLVRASPFLERQLQAKKKKRFRTAVQKTAYTNTYWTAFIDKMSESGPLFTPDMLRAEQPGRTAVFAVVELYRPHHFITSMVGGRYSFYRFDIEQVYNALAVDFANQNPGYLIQNATVDSGLRFFVDVDTSDLLLPPNAIDEFARAFRDTIAAYYSDYDTHPIPVFVSVCSPRLKKSKLTTNIHAVAHVRVSIEQCAQLIEGVRCRWNALMPPERRDKVELDGAVYHATTRTGTLRMIHTRKLVKCPACQRKDRMTTSACSLCASTGDVETVEMYRPYVAYGARGYYDDAFFKRTHETNIDVVRNHSIWSIDPSERRSDYRVPNTDVTVDVSNLSAALQRTGVNTRTTAREQHTDRKRASRSRGRNPAPKGREITNEEVLDEIEHLIKLPHRPGELFQSIWGQIEVQRVTVMTNKAIVNIVGADSTYCTYKRGHHKSNRVYFEIQKDNRVYRETNPFHMVQRCYDEECKSLPEYDWKKARHNELHAFNMHRSLRSMLWPDMDPLTTLDKQLGTEIPQRYRKFFPNLKPKQPGSSGTTAQLSRKRKQHS